jgi:hypothetical protein
MSSSAGEHEKVIYMYLSTFQYLHFEIVHSFSFVDDILWVDVWLFMFGKIAAHFGNARYFLWEHGF